MKTIKGILTFLAVCLFVGGWLFAMFYLILQHIK